MSNRRTPAKKSAAKRGSKITERPTTLRDALAAKKQRIEIFNLPLVESADADRAGAAFKSAQQQVDYIEAALGREPTEDRAKEQLARARASRDAAEQVLDECFFPIRLRYIGQEPMDAIMSAHPPTEEQQKDDFTFDPVAALPEVLALAVVDGDLDAEQWREELADDERWTTGDRRQLRELAYRVQHRAFSDGIPSV